MNVVLRDTWQVERRGAEFQSAALRFYTRVSTLKTKAVGVSYQNARAGRKKNRTSGRENKGKKYIYNCAMRLRWAKEDGQTEEKRIIE